jgi:hypothetical protein
MAISVIESGSDYVSSFSDNKHETVAKYTLAPHEALAVAS